MIGSNFWHEHFNCEERGSLNSRDRRQHLGAMFTAFEKVIEQLKNFKGKYQAWLLVSTLHPIHDVLFVHTPNPNHDNFPYKFEGFSFEVAPPNLLLPFIKEEFEIGTLARVVGNHCLQCGDLQRCWRNSLESEVRYGGVFGYGRFALLHCIFPVLRSLQLGTRLPEKALPRLSLTRDICKLEQK